MKRPVLYIYDCCGDITLAIQYPDLTVEYYGDCDFGWDESAFSGVEDLPLKNFTVIGEL